MDKGIIEEGICYVLVQVDEYHPIAHKRHDLVWYPERGMSLLDCVNYTPYVKSVVTENPWIIACYDREHVRVWRKGRWRRKDSWQMPNSQTYGASQSNITHTLLGIQCTIPTCAAGYEAWCELKAKLNKLYKKAQGYKR